MPYHRALNRSVVGRLVLTAALFAALGLGVSAPRAVRADTAFHIDTSTDAHDSNLADGVCSNGVDGCNLRAAVEQAFSVSQPVTITFGSSFDGTTLLLSNSLGTIVWNADQVTVDGEGHNLTISGENLNAGQSIFRIQGNHNTLRNLTIKNAKQDGVQIGDFVGVGGGLASHNLLDQLAIIGSGASGVYVSGQSGGGQDNTIQGSYIGASTWNAPCVAGEGNTTGIWIDDGAIGTTIGRDTGINFIICNTSHGVHIAGAGGLDNTQLAYNRIGTNGDIAQGNGEAGIYNAASYGTVIDHNVVSGNGWAGVWIDDSSGIAITANYIGTNWNGTAAIPNGHDGIALTDGTQQVTVGGSSAAERNIISGNSLCGVRIRDGSNENELDYNLIGLNATGTAAIPNAEAGIAIFNNSNDNSIGTSASSVVQYVSGNGREGIYVENSSLNVIGQTSGIGVAADGTTPLGNGLQGVMLNGAISTTVAAKIIAYNGGAGVAVVGDTATGNYASPDNVYGNAGLPIDLGNDGFTPNGPSSSGPNHWLHYPVITAANANVITGTACANCTVYIFRAVGNPATPGGGGLYAEEATADSLGAWSATLASDLSAARVSLQACQQPCSYSSDTSEMSPRPQVFLPVILRS